MRENTFTVYGTGTFPIDMLRYDACFPDTALDAALIAPDKTRELYRETRYITLCSMQRAGWRPTVARWESFGWQVKDHRGY